MLPLNPYAESFALSETWEMLLKALERSMKTRQAVIQGEKTFFNTEVSKFFITDLSIVEKFFRALTRLKFEILILLFTCLSTRETKANFTSSGKLPWKYCYLQHLSTVDETPWQIMSLVQDVFYQFIQPSWRLCF